MIIENVEPIESATMFTTHSADSDHTILLLEKANCTHGTIAMSILQKIIIECKVYKVCVISIWEVDAASI